MNLKILPSELHVILGICKTKWLMREMRIKMQIYVLKLQHWEAHCIYCVCVQLVEGELIPLKEVTRTTYYTHVCNLYNLLTDTYIPSNYLPHPYSCVSSAALKMQLCFLLPSTTTSVLPQTMPILRDVNWKKIPRRCCLCLKHFKGKSNPNKMCHQNHLQVLCTEIHFNIGAYKVSFGIFATANQAK